MVYLPVSSREALHMQAIEELREHDFETFENFIMQKLTKDLELKSSVFKRKIHTINYTAEEVGDSGFRYQRQINDDDGAGSRRRGCLGFLRLPRSIKTLQFEFVPSDAEELSFTFTRHVRLLSEFIMREENLRQAGIFLKSGSIEMQQQLSNALKTSKYVDFDQLGCTVHDCADLLKQLLKQMSEPLFPTKYYPAYERLAKLAAVLEREQSLRKRLFARSRVALAPPDSELLVKERLLIDCLQLITHLMSHRRLELFANIMDILLGVCKHRQHNRMNAITLGAIFAPLLIVPRGLPNDVANSAGGHMSKLVTRMLLVGKEIFGAPVKFRLKIWKHILHSRHNSYKMRPSIVCHNR